MDLFLKEINDAIRTLPRDKAWAEKMAKLLKLKTKLSK